MEKIFELTPQTWQNTATGQQITATTVVKEVSRENFEITYLAFLTDLLDMLGTKKIHIAKYLLTHRNSDNMIIKTYREIADETGFSTRTVMETVNRLKSAGLVATKTGVIMLNPKLINHGSLAKEKYLLIKFQEMQRFELKTFSETVPVVNE